MTSRVYLITGNSDKVKAARKAFNATSIELEQLDRNYREIQAPSSLEVARHTVEQALQDCDGPIIREDHSVFLDAIPGFPGPYMSYFDQKLPAEKLLELLEGRERTGYFEISAVLGMPDGGMQEYSFRVPVEIAEEIRGDERNWDRALKLKGEDRTFAESSEDQRLDVWNQNFREIAEDLGNK